MANIVQDYIYQRPQRDKRDAFYKWKEYMKYSKKFKKILIDKVNSDYDIDIDIDTDESIFNLHDIISYPQLSFNDVSIIITIYYIVIINCYFCVL